MNYKRLFFFGIAVFMSSVATSIILIAILMPLIASNETLEIIVGIAVTFVTGLMYWSFYGKRQLAKHREKRVHEAELGLEKSPLIKKKYIIYAGVLIGEFIFFQLLSTILNVSLSNTWLGQIAVNVLLITVLIMLFNIVKTIKSTNGKVSCILYFIGVVAFFTIALANVLILAIGY